MLQIRSFNGLEVAYRQSTADGVVLNQGFEHDIFFSGVPKRQAAGTDVVVDAGAHRGTPALLAASKVARGGVYPVEASRDTFNFLL